MSRSIRLRFYRELLIFGLIVVVAGGIAMLRVYFWGLEDSTRLSYMDIARSVEEGEIPDDVLQNDWPENNPQVWRGFNALPDDVRTLFPKHFHRDNVLLVQYGYRDTGVAGEPSEGLTFNLLKGPPQHIHFFLPYLTSSGQTLYVYHAISTSGFREKTRQETVTLIIVINCAILLLLMLWLARRLSGVVLKPIAALSHMAEHINEADPRQEFEASRENNEIGDVARTLQHSMQRIQQYHERERQFLRQASHELRTPIAVIRSALDVVEQRRRAGNLDFERPLQDIERAENDMRSLVEALLWLARADTLQPEKVRIDVAQEVASVVDDNRHLLGNKAVVPSVQIAEHTQLVVEQPYFRMVINNLIRNAFEHADAGDIVITYQPSCLSVNNPIADANSTGFGIGITVIEAITEKLDWTFTLDTGQGRVQACLQLPDDRGV